MKSLAMRTLGVTLMGMLMACAAAASVNAPLLWSRHPGPDATGAVIGVDESRHRLLLVAAQSSDESLGVIWYRGLDTDSGWRGVPLPPLAPRPFTGARMVFDYKRDRAVFLRSGPSQVVPVVWALDLNSLSTWTQIPSTAGGPVEQIINAYYDFGLDRVICTGNTAVWSVDVSDSVRWRPFVSATAPADHFGGGRTYDTRRHRLLLHGGSTGNWTRFSGHLWSDLWALDAAAPDTAQWRMVSASTAFNRVGHWAAYDSLRDRFVAHQGIQGWLVPARDTRSIELANPLLDQVLAAVSVDLPLGDLHVDPVGDALLIQEGLLLKGLPLAGGAWTPRDTLSYIENYHYIPRTVLDIRRRRLMLFGGGRPEEPSNDVWVLSLEAPSQWKKLEAAGTRPEARVGASIAFDEVNDRLLIYGGYVAGRDFTDTWELGLSGEPLWAPLGSASAYAAYDAPAIYDPARNRLLVWTYVPQAPPAKLIEFRFDDALGWRLVNTTGPPPTSYWRQSSAFDPGRERWLHFGAGYYGPNDTRLWSFDLNTDAWSVNGLIDGHRWELVSGMFDPVEDRLVLFGGRYSTIPSTAVYPTELFSFPIGSSDVAQPMVTKGVGPTPREFPWMAYDPVRDGLLLLGGGGPVYSTLCEQDFWTIDRGRRSVRRQAAIVGDSTAQLRWDVPSHRGVLLFLWRRGDASAWVPTDSAVVGSDGLVSFDGRSLQPGTRYGFRLREAAGGGFQPLDQYWVRMSGVATPPIEPGPQPLLRVLQNPARAQVRFLVHLTQPTSVHWELLDLQGRILTQRDEGVLNVGEHALQAGTITGAGSGVLFLRVSAGDSEVVSRVALLR